MLLVEPNPLLDLRAFESTITATIGKCTPTPQLSDLLAHDADAPIRSSEEVRNAVRKLLRQGGFKPAGRSKPASEYLLRSAGESGGRLPSINLAVDVCNVISMHSGLPISLVDLDRTVAPLRVASAPEGSSYVFNPAGQVMELEGLLCLFDAFGPIANGVKDCQRTKTTADTQRTLTIIWGTTELPGRAAEAERWYHRLLIAHGIDVTSIWPSGSGQ
jgi:DNA/RNA-binding domain of Phe-tRNA-synthetase-like protein